MPAQVHPRRRFGRPVAAMIIVAGLAVSTYAASAASLDVESADLYATSKLLVVDLPLAYDHFDDCAGKELNLDPGLFGNIWWAQSNIWACEGNRSRVTTNDQNALHDSATVHVGQSDLITISTYLARTSRTANGAGSGLSLFHDGNTHHMYIVYQRGADQITLGKVDGSGDADIVSFDYLPRTDTMELVATIAKPDITVSANGTVLGTYTMTTGELSTFGPNARFGLESDGDRRSRWDWFEVVDDS